MKKLFTLFVVMVASVGMMFAESGTCGENLTWDLTNGVLTISGTGEMTNVEDDENPAPWYEHKESILSVVIENNVTSIGDGAFNGCRYLTSVTIPNSITSIGLGAFASCVYLTSITIPNSVTSIGKLAFFSCMSLTSIEIPNSVTSIGDGPFYSCISLTSINVAADNPNYTSFDGVLFNKDITALIQYPGGKQGEYIIPNSVTSIGYGAFNSCSGLTSIEIPNSVISIGERAFEFCSGLTSVTIPNSVTSIGERAFDSCTGLTTVTIPNSVTSIGDGPFCNCSGLTSINVAADNPNYTSFDGVLFNKDKTTLIQYPEGKQGEYIIPNSVTSIGWGAFIYCSGLTSIEIPNSVTSIGGYAFFMCTSLKSITLPDSITSIGEWAFYDCTGLTTMTIPNSVTSIGNHAFYQCGGLTTVTISNSVTNIGRSVFERCSGLTSVTIPNSVTSIGEWAFFGCASLTSIEIPNSVTNIGREAFYGCSGLTSITCQSVTPPTLNSEAFGYVDKSIPLYVPADSLELYRIADQWKEFTNILPIPGTEVMEPTTVAFSVRFPASNCPKDVELVGSFNNWIGTAMTWNSSTGYYETMCEASASDEFKFRGAGSWDQQLEWYDEQDDKWVCFNNFVISNWWEDVAGGKLIMIDFSDSTLYGWSGTAEPTPCIIASGTCGDSLTWKLSCDSVLTISGTGEMTKFESYSAVPWYSKTGSITSVVIEEGVTSIGRDAFYSCSRLASVTIPNSVTRIGSNAFEYCISLTSIELPNSLTSIEYGVFWGCTNLTSILIPNSVTSIGWDAFYGCRSLTSIEIPNRVTSIGMNAFVGCSGITSLDIPNSVTNIEPGAFSSCTNLISVELPDSITTIEDSVFISCANLTSIEIPGGVTSIGLLAFYRCSGLTSITCQSVTPPTLGPEAFGYVDKSIPLYVPGASIDAYKAAEGWKEFFNILPISGTEIPEYSVIFLNWNGELLSEQSIAHNEAAVAPELPEREGFIFKGWTADIEHIVARTFAIALYDKVGVEVTYKAEDGEVLFSEHADLHFPNVPSIDGKTFSGWLTEMADNTNGIVLRATYTVDKPTEDDDVNVVPSSTTADVNFPYVTGAITYMLVISDMSDQVVCKIMFDANGKLLGIAFAPGRNGNKQQTPQVFGFTFKVEGLNPNTTYKYEFVAHDDEDEVIETLTGSFTTMAEAPSDVEYPEAENLSSVTKFIQDDQVLILRGDKAYTATGQEVK